MEGIDMTINGGNQQLVARPVPFARSYQLEALERAIKQNTIVFFETGTGKTLISVMLLRSYAHLLRKPSPYFAVFLVPTVVLVKQQGDVVATHTDLRVGKYYGELGVDFWDAAIWEQQKDEHEVLVMTPQILLDALRHRFLRLDQIKVLIFDECHNARGKHPYACIMKEIYHRQLASNVLPLPRVFGMTASPIKAKASNSAPAYWERIRELENLMNSKVFTCDSDSALVQYISFSTPKVKIYKDEDIPLVTIEYLTNSLIRLFKKHEQSLSGSDVLESVANSARKRLHKLLSIFMFCFSELGVWLAMKAAEIFSHEEEDIFSWGRMDMSVERVVKAFSSHAIEVFSASLPSDLDRLKPYNLITNPTAGYLTPKVMCLIRTLLEYREVKDLRCIVFVERIVTAIVIRCLLNELLPELTGWRSEYTAGSTYKFQAQSRKEQNTIVEEFRKGTVNIIVATSMLEEGLDVQSCNLVIRFDPSATICSFIQSRGRARMQNSDFVLMVKSGDTSALDRVKKYLASGDIMRRECLSHADLSCEPLDGEMLDEEFYEVESTRAFVTLSSSVQLLYFYCSRLPSDGYFKPYPRFTIDKDQKICALNLPKSCPIQKVTVQGHVKLLKQLACLEACRKLHQVAALTDNLVPDIVEEEAEAQKFGSEPYCDEHAKYFPPELISSCSNEAENLYHCYLIEPQPDFQYDVKPQNIVLAVHARLEKDLETLNLDLDADRGRIGLGLNYIGSAVLTSQQVSLCRRFQITVFRILLDHKLNKLNEYVDELSQKDDSAVFDYLLIPALKSHSSIKIDWKCVTSVSYSNAASFDRHTDFCPPRGHGQYVHTKNGFLCSCMLDNSLVCTPHNGFLYCIAGSLDGFNGKTYLELNDGESVTYQKYYEQRHGIKLLFEGQTLLNGKRIFTVENYLQRCRTQRAKGSSTTGMCLNKDLPQLLPEIILPANCNRQNMNFPFSLYHSHHSESSNRYCELPPELCQIIMSPISISTFYSFSFLPSVMHRIESLLIASNFKSLNADLCMQNVVIPSLKILEAITTKKCQEKLHLESLETLGDSFLKYATSQQLFKTYQNQHEGLLSIKREKRISNATLCKLGCERKIAGFIRDEPFEPQKWIIPGDKCEKLSLEEQLLSSKKIYSGGNRKIKSKRVADVVEALIGAFLSTGGESAALSFMTWLGINVDFVIIPYTRDFSVNPELHVNIKYFQRLLNYSFRDPSLLVEAITHGSYMLPEIPQCYQRLEFLGDAVLDYLITVHLYCKYPDLSPGLLTDLRSASVNNDCYAQSALRRGLHKHVLHTSQELYRQIANTVSQFNELSSISTFGWESEITFPKVLGDVIESLAGAILVDSGYDKDIVFQSIRPLLEPMITPETVRLHPVRELTELCQKEHYIFKKPIVSKEKGVAYVTVEVEANGVVHKTSCSGVDKKTAKKLACKTILKSLKESMSSVEV